MRDRTSSSRDLASCWPTAAVNKKQAFRTQEAGHVEVGCLAHGLNPADE